jgi:hypothetical protein
MASKISPTPGQSGGSYNQRVLKLMEHWWARKSRVPRQINGFPGVSEAAGQASASLYVPHSR